MIHMYRLRANSKAELFEEKLKITVELVFVWSVKYRETDQLLICLSHTVLTIVLLFCLILSDPFRFMCFENVN